METIGQLRPVKDEEVELMRSWRNAPSVRANMYTRHEISPEEHRAWWERTCRRDDQQYCMYEFSGSPAGIVGFMTIDRINSNSSWAFYAAPDASKGTGSRMEYLALEHVFNALGLHKLHCEVFAFNTPVIRLHQKFGFQVEGVFREHHKVDDSFVDVYRLGLLDVEWANRREQMLEKVLATRRG